MSHNHTEHLCANHNLHVFYIGYDLLDEGLLQVKNKFNDELFNDIPAFAFGPNVLEHKLETDGVVATVREAMKKMYDIPEIKEARKRYLEVSDIEDKYLKRGEFGELLLYHLLHEYFDADALISKIYFKSSLGVPAHGFDAVHVDLDNKLLWLGESKLYQKASRAIEALATDILGYTDKNGKKHNGHFCTDFFNSEFQIITNRVHDTREDYPDFIKQLIDPNTKVLNKLANINIALFAGFESPILTKFGDEEFEQLLLSEAEQLQVKFNDKLSEHAWSSELNTFLFLFPFDNKREFVTNLHYKLEGAQKI